MKKSIRILILALLSLFYRISKPFLSNRRIAILVYHSIADKGDALTVSTDIFRRQMTYLKENNYKFITPEELDDMISGRMSIVGKNVLLTFDDGYRDFMTNALPILSENGLSAAIFIHTDRSNNNFSNTIPLMGWDDIRRLSEYNMVIGNHSHSHPDMKKLSPEELETEIKISEDILNKELGSVSKIFTYPGGKYNNQVIEAIKNNGYRMAFTINKGLIVRGDDPFKLKRIGVRADTNLFEFSLILTPAFNWYQVLRKWVN